ncbi:MAG: 5'/3'-nucleotidase SurE [Eubacterium sp.]|nr:5'/3'-nucleotidase SurE [Eubacterium sp.]
MKNILVVNDDGINSDGLLRLVKAAKKFGEVWVVAPESQRSATSHSITLRNYLDLHRCDFPVEGVVAYSCSGQPADCVRVGVLNVMDEKPDIVFSGINFGYNVASDLQYSGTAGAAFEAVFQGIPAIAFSESGNGIHEATDKYLEEIIGKYIDIEHTPGKILNVNFPGCKIEDFKGIKENVGVSTGMFYNDRYIEQERFEDGGMRLFVEGVFDGAAEEGTDFSAVLNGYIAVGYVNNVGC